MRKLQITNFVLLLLVIGYLIYHHKQQHLHNSILEELSVERLNVVGKDGKKYVVISNPDKQALPTLDGKLLDPDQKERRTPGLIFFNSEGDEVGGLIFEGDSTSSYQLLTFDQRKNDQVMTLRRDEELVDGKWKRSYGLLLQERSDKPFKSILAEMKSIGNISDSTERAQKMASFWENPDHLAPQRLFLGRTQSGKIGLFLRDKENNPRLSIYVDSLGNPIIEAVDSLGQTHKTWLK